MTFCMAIINTASCLTWILVHWQARSSVGIELVPMASRDNIPIQRVLGSCAIGKSSGQSGAACESRARRKEKGLPWPSAGPATGACKTR